MLEELISSKHIGNPSEYVELEERTLEQKVQIKELRVKNMELEKELSVKSRDEKDMREKLREYEENEARAAKRKEKVMRQKGILEENKGKIQALLAENASLRAQMNNMERVDIKREVEPSQNGLVDQLKAEIDKCKKEKEEHKKRADAADRKLQEKEREIREEKSKAKEKEEEFTLSLFEEKEKLNQKLVRSKQN
jgi:hypothetical protein